MSVYSNEALSPDELKSIWDVADESENPAESLKERYPNSNVWREKQTAYSDHDSINIGLNGTHQEDATYEYNLWANDFNPQATKSALERAKRSSLIGEKIAEIYSDGKLPKSTLHLQADIDRLLKQVPKKHKKKATVVDELEEEPTADDVTGSTDPIEQRAREALKAAGLENDGAFESRGISVKVVSSGKSEYTQVSVDMGKGIGLTERDINAYKKISEQFNAQPGGGYWAFYCANEDAPALKRAFEIYLGNSVDEQIRKAFENLRNNHDFTDEQLKWLNQIEEFTYNHKAYGRISVENFDDDFAGRGNKAWDFKTKGGGFEGLNKIFDGKLAELIDEVNEYINGKSKRAGTGKNANTDSKATAPIQESADTIEQRANEALEYAKQPISKWRSKVGILESDLADWEPQAREQRLNAIEPKIKAEILSPGKEVYLSADGISNVGAVDFSALGVINSLAKFFNADIFNDPTPKHFRRYSFQNKDDAQAFAKALGRTLDVQFAIFDNIPDLKAEPRKNEKFAPTTIKAEIMKLDKKLVYLSADGIKQTSDLGEELVDSIRKIAEACHIKDYNFNIHKPDAGGTFGTLRFERVDDAREFKERLERFLTNKAIIESSKPYEAPGHNFHITEDSGIGEGGLKEKFKQNVAAIKLLKQLEAENRKATPSEQEILAKFNGWGTLAPAFAKTPQWEKENRQLRELLTPDEYAAAHGSINNAFYTDPKVAQAIWSGLERLGFKGGRILDPSMGSGIFFGTMPAEVMARSELAGGEIDSLTGRIAQQLYQNAYVGITPFQNFTLPDNWFDLAISNVPFGSISYDYGKEEYRLHDYFFAKSMDKVRPGGLVAFITSTGTLTNNNKLQQAFEGKADLIAAYKLPSNTFDKNAKTQVTSDIVIFQKRVDPNVASEHAQPWAKVDNFVSDGKKFKTNEYFITHPENMIGTPTEDKLYPGKGRMALDGTGRDVVKELNDLMKKLPKDIYAPIQRTTTATTSDVLKAALARNSNAEGTFTVENGKAYQMLNGKPAEITGQDAQAVKNYLSLMKNLDALLKAQLDPAITEEKVSELRKGLNQKYDAFVKNHGYLNSPKNFKLFGADPKFGRVAAIEDYSVDKKTVKDKNGKEKTIKQESAKKADIFFQRTAQAINDEPTSAGTPQEGLNISLSLRGRVDMDYISNLTGKSISELERELGDMIYRNPETNLHELAEEYLSGNVREKLAVAQKAARLNPAFKRNVAALEKVQPRELTADDIYPHLGATWIAPEYYEDFAKYLLDLDYRHTDIRYGKATGIWAINGSEGSGDFHNKWSVRDTKWDCLNLLEAAMNNRSIVVKRTVNRIETVDEVKTAEANAKIEKIKDAFENWIWQDPDRRKALVEHYNREFNSDVLREYDGSHLTFPGLAPDVKDKLYPHQKNVIWRIIQGGNTLIAHCVGAGKTWAMQIAGMELKRLGKIKKPMYVVPNAIVEQFERDFHVAYPGDEAHPGARILVLTSKDLAAPKLNFTYTDKLNMSAKESTPKSALKDDTKETAEKRQERLGIRRRTLMKIATGNWDGIIISHDLFQRLPISPETENKFIQEQIRTLMAEKAELELRRTGKPGGGTGYEKKVQNAIDRATERLNKNFQAIHREMITPFEELGIDQIFVDEADCFKNLGFNSTGYSGRSEPGKPLTVGVSTSNADRSLDMYIKCRLLTEMAKMNGRDGAVVFATGTPISNTLNEIFTMQRYLDYDALVENSMNFFGGWAGNFARGVPSIRISPTKGDYEPVIRLKLTNLHTLIKQFRKIADIKMPEDVPHLKRPKLKNGVRTVIEIEPTQAFKDYRKEVLKRVEAIENGEVEPTEDNPLKIVTDLRKASLDMRMVNSSVPASEAGVKIDALCDMVTTKYKETADFKGTQLICSDIGVPKDRAPDKEDISDEQAALEEETSADDMAIYQRVKQGLIKRGIPANQIAFVHDAKKPEERQALFDRVNNGEIRVIIGSTTKIGTGVNIQKKLCALHHLDCPWRPRDIDQREGRILRTGNQNEEVEIFTYVMKGSYDANQWELVTNKKELYDSLLRGDPSMKEIMDISQEAAELEAIQASAEEDPLAKERTKISSELRQLRYLQQLHLQGQHRYKADADKIKKQIPQFEKRIKNIQADIADKIDTRGDAFKMKIGNTEYTKRPEADKAFDELIQNFTNSTNTKIGEIGGFNIMARAEYTMANRGGVMETVSKRVVVQLSNHGTYSVNPSRQSMESFISQGINTELAREKNSLGILQKDLARLEKLIGGSFDKQARLGELEARYNQLTAQLKIQDNAYTKEDSDAEQRTKPAQETENIEQADANEIAPEETPSENDDAQTQITYPEGYEEPVSAKSPSEQIESQPEQPKQGGEPVEENPDNELHDAGKFFYTTDSSQSRFITAALKKSDFPLGKLSDKAQERLNELAEKHNAKRRLGTFELSDYGGVRGYVFGTNQDRDAFIQDVIKDGFLDEESSQQQRERPNQTATPEDIKADVPAKADDYVSVLKQIGARIEGNNAIFPSESTHKKAEAYLNQLKEDAKTVAPDEETTPARLNHGIIYGFKTKSGAMAYRMVYAELGDKPEVLSKDTAERYIKNGTAVWLSDASADTLYHIALHKLSTGWSPRGSYDSFTLTAGRLGSTNKLTIKEFEIICRAQEIMGKYSANKITPKEAFEQMAELLGKENNPLKIFPDGVASYIEKNNLLSDDNSKKLTPEEIELMNLTPETLTVDDQLKAKLHDKFPSAAKTIDIWADMANRPLQGDRRKDSMRTQGRERLISLLKADAGKFTDEAVLSDMASMLHAMWWRDMQAKNNTSAKTKRIDKQAEQLQQDYHDKKITAQEYYQQMGELLYPKEFAQTADAPLTDAQITEAAKNPDTAQQLPPAKQTDAPQQIITASKPATAKSLSDVKNFRELGQYLKKVWKMQLIPHYQKLSFERLKSYLLGFEDVLSQFTRSWGRVSKMGMDYRTNLIGSFGWGAFRRQLSLNIKYKEFAKKMGKGDHLRATGRHEAGHFIDNLTEIRLGIANPRYREHSKDLVEWAYEILKQNGETRSLLEMRANISDYATKNYSETVAEAVKQYIEYRVEAAPLSKAIFDCLKRADTTDEWFNREILGIKPGTKRLHEFAGRLTSGAVLKWYTHHNNKGTADTKTLQGYAAALLYDGGLRENLEKLRNEGADTQSWEETLKAHVPDEKIMASSDEWTDARINEAAKITYVANAFDQLGAEIKNGKVTFPDEETKQLCINHLKEIENPDFRLSLTGSGDTTISNFLSTHELTDQQRLIQRMGRDMGVCVVFFSNDNANFRGAHAGNISYINVKGNWNLGKVFWHESSHWIKANNRELWEQIRDAADITPEQRKAYVKETQRTDLKTDAEIDEEIISDYMEDAVKRAGFLSKLGRKDPSLVQRIVAWLQDAMSKFFEYFNNPTGKLTNAQRDRMANELGRVAKDLVNQKGEKLFRYNNRTHALTLPDGRSLKTLARTPGSVIDLQQAIGDNDNEISQRVFDKYLNEVLMKEVRDNVREQIGEYVDFSQMDNPTERDKARDKLPYINQMMTRYNLSRVQKDEAYKNRLAVKIEYARRCFDNDRRIQNEALRQVDRHDGQSGVHKTRSSTVSGDNTQGTGRQLRGIDVGISRHVPGGQSAARNHFLKLYDEAAKELANERNSGKRGSFSNGKTAGNKTVSRSEKKFYLTVPATDENMGIANQLGAVLENGQMVFYTAEGAEAYEQHRQNVARKQFKYSFAGEKALTASHEKLAEAQQMEEDGKSRSAIFKKTGWVKGKDDKWRFEIPDNLDKINFDKLKRDGQSTLGEVYDNSKLYEAYPELENIPVDIKGSRTFVAQFHPVKNRITLNKKILKDDPLRIKGSLVHEIQHAIQTIESFASGGSEEYVDQLLARAITQIDKEIEEITGIHDASAAFGIKASARFGEYFLTNFRGENKIDEQKQKELRKNLSETANKRLDYLVERALELQKAYYSVKISDYDKYKKIGGEEEAEEVRYRAEAFYRETDYLPKKRRELANAKAEFEAIKAKATKEQLEIFGEYKATVKAIEEISSNPNVLKDPNYNGGKWKHAEVNRLLERLEGDLEYYKGRKIVRAYIKQDKLAQEVAREESALKMGKGTPTVHSADALITYNGEEYAMASMAPPETAQTKFAGNGDLERMFAEAKPVTNAQLNDRQRKWVELGKNLGVQVQWIDAHTDLKGALKDGVIYLNRRANDKVEKTFWHEQFHLTAALQPELYRDLLKYFSGNDAFTKDQLDAYRKENNRPDLTDEAVIEEILSDNFGQVQKRVQLLRELGRDDSSLAERFITWLKYLADKVAATFRNPEGGMTTAQRDAFIKGISDLADSMQVTDAATHEGTKFSAAPSTTEKLKTKIQNLFTQTQNERPRKHMVKLLENLSGYQIRTGHVAEGIDILVKDISKIIRTKRAYDWELMLPEVGKLVAKRLNINPTKEQGNYIASWLMDGAPNDTSQAAKDFQRAMREADPMYRDQLLEVQSIFSDWANRSAEQIIEDSMAFENEKKPLANQARDFLDKGYQQFVDEIYPVKQLVDEYEQDNGKKLAADEDPYVLLRNSYGAAGRAKILVEGENESAIDAIKTFFPNIDYNKYKTPLKTIRMILDSVDALDNKEKRKQFSKYLTAWAVKDIHKQNAANMRQQYELRDKIDTLGEELDTLTDKKKIKQTEKRIAKLQDELDAVKKKFKATPWSEKACDEYIAQYKDKYGEAHRHLMRYSRMLLDIMVDSGLLSEDEHAGYIKNSPNHVPLFRKFDENEDKNYGDSTKERTGSSRDIIDPLGSVIRNTYDFIRRAEKNKAKILLANLARTGGTGRIVEERTILDEVDNKKPDINTTITFYENGEKKYLETDPSVVKAVNNMTVPQMSWYMKILRFGTTLLRNFATVYNPAFAFRNLCMDYQNAFLYNKYGIFSPADFVRGFLSVWNRDADYSEWMAMGGAQASFWSVDRDYAQASIDRLRKGRWGQYKSKPWQILSVFGEYSELGTRVGYYKKAKAALAKKNGGKIDRGILIQAALESRDLTDFARGGKTSRDFNNTIAFFNASIQGWDKFARTYDPRQYWSKDPEVRKEWERAMFRLAVGSILPTVLCFMINTGGDDDDWYEKDLPDWERQTHWIFGEDIRVPKGQDVGLRFFSNLTESMLRYMSKNDPKAFENWFRPVIESLPDWCPTALQPILECAMNYDMFRKNAIVPARQQKLPEYMQYDNRTSETAKWLGDSSLVKFLINEKGVAPAKVDHFLYGYTGKMGQEILRAAESAAPWVDREYNFKGISDFPLIGGFFRVPYRNPRIMNEYYETLDEQTKLHNEFKMTGKRPEGYNHSLYTKLHKAQEQMQELTKKERKVLDDTKLDGDERDNRQLAIQKKRVALAEKVLR